MSDLSSLRADRSPSIAAAVHNALRGGRGAATASALALAIALSSVPVRAQESAAPAEERPGSTGASSAATTTELEEVVVTGIREQLLTSQARKQEAEELVDSVTAVEIGALPDRSVTEVLQRIPGLAIGRVPEPRDADRIAVEGSGVTVRGLTWVRSELNGRSAFSAKNSRTLGFEDVPPELMAAVDVYKNPSAAQIEGGLSGTVDLRTRLPFDSPDRKMAVSAEYTTGDLADEARPSGSFLYSDRFSTDIGELGFLASLSQSELTSRTNTYHVDKYYARTDLVPGQTIFAPGGVGWRELTVDRERMGASAALQWKSNGGSVDASLQYFLADATFEQDENAMWNTPGAGLNGNNLVFDGNYLVGGNFNDNGFSGSTRYNEKTARNDDVGLHVNWRATDRLSFSTDVQRSTADTRIMDLTIGPAVGPQFQRTAAYTVQLNGSSEPTIVVPQNDLLTNPDMVFHNWAMDHHEHNEAEAWAYRADGEFTFDNGDWLDRIRFGVRHEDFESITRETGFRWGSISQAWGSRPDEENPGQVLGPAVFSRAGMPQIYGLQSFTDWFHGGKAPSGFLFHNARVFRNYQSFANAVTSIERAPGVFDACNCSWTPWTGDYSGTIPANDGLGINPQEQKTYAAYVVAHFEFGKLDGNVGVRGVRTESTGQGLLRFGNGNLASTIPAADRAFMNGTAAITVGDNTYTDWLPSLNLRYKVQDDLFLRFALGKSISRPNYPLLLPSVPITATEGRVINGACTEKASGDQNPSDCVFAFKGQSGNPDLEPMRSWQVDVTAEWYMSPTNSLTGAIFYKDLSGFMETTLGASVPYTNNGVTRNVVLLRPENQGDGKVQGFEVAYNGFFDFLPGFWRNFGARAAFTYVESSGTRNSASNPFSPVQLTNSQIDDYPLEGLSKTSYNAEIYYSTGAFEARAAYNWRERYLLTMAAANVDVPAFADDYGQLDASVQWSVTDEVTVGVQGVNLTTSTYRVLLDALNGSGLQYHNWVDSDRRYSAFVRVSF